jgi:hypothetical protein
MIGTRTRLRSLTIPKMFRAIMKEQMDGQTIMMKLPGTRIKVGAIIKIRMRRQEIPKKISGPKDGPIVTLMMRVDGTLLILLRAAGTTRQTIIMDEGKGTRVPTTGAEIGKIMTKRKATIDPIPVRAGMVTNPQKCVGYSGGANAFVNQIAASATIFNLAEAAVVVHEKHHNNIVQRKLLRIQLNQRKT